MTISCWPKMERPRERLLKHGVKTLSNAELLAIFLRTGRPGKTALDLARDLLNTFGGLDKVLEANLKKFTSIKGLGVAKFCQLQASLELVRRHHGCKVEESISFTNHDLAKNYLLSNFTHLEHETFACLLLDNKNKLIRFETLFTGTINHAQIYPRVVAQSCLKHNAAAIIFAHNHPSGCLNPSESDRSITMKLIKLLDLIDVRVLDHFIVGKNDVYSMAQNGLITL
ncbi:MAG TPA: JAB domain-containing protein [Oceanospirillales bacterium]|nr:JAB domain-containing protein [Oceanospirillales bacterium]